MWLSPRLLAGLVPNLPPARRPAGAGATSAVPPAAGQRTPGVPRPGLHRPGLRPPAQGLQREGRLMGYGVARPKI